MVLAKMSTIFLVVYVTNAANFNLLIAKKNLCRSSTGRLASHKYFFLKG